MEPMNYSQAWKTLAIYYPKMAEEIAEETIEANVAFIVRKITLSDEAFSPDVQNIQELFYALHKEQAQADLLEVLGAPSSLEEAFSGYDPKKIVDDHKLKQLYRLYTDILHGTPRFYVQINEKKLPLSIEFIEQSEFLSSAFKDGFVESINGIIDLTNLLENGPKTAEALFESCLTQEVPEINGKNIQDALFLADLLQHQTIKEKCDQFLLKLIQEGAEDDIDAIIELATSEQFEWRLDKETNKMERISLGRFFNSPVIEKTFVNELSKKNATFLIGLLERGDLKLDYLSLRDISEEFLFSGLIQALQKQTNLKELHLTHTAMSAENVGKLADSLKGLNQLTYLDISWNELGPEGATALAPALEKLVQLEKLNISRNKLGPEGATILAPTLEKLVQLERLNISWNQLGPGGATVLAPALEKLVQLKQLDISKNQLGSEGATILAPALEKLVQLKQLEISKNQLGSEGTTILAPALEKLVQLERLNISRNWLGPEGATVFKSLRERGVRVEL